MPDGLPERCLACGHLTAVHGNTRCMHTHDGICACQLGKQDTFNLYVMRELARLYALILKLSSPD